MAPLPDRTLAEALAIATDLFARLVGADPMLRALLLRHTTQAGVPSREMASGAGHDCATFAGLGVPSATLFLRNDRGSHNPHEALEMADVGAGLAVLAPAVAHLLGQAASPLARYHAAISPPCRKATRGSAARSPTSASSAAMRCGTPVM